MKIISFLFIITCLCVLSGSPANGQETNKITTGINFVNAPADKVLDLYVASAKSPVIIASNVQQATHRITLQATAVSPQVAQQMIEQALLKQAGIVITRLDDKRISVTYNDRLELGR
jgi:hypothetical protein